MPHVELSLTEDASRLAPARTMPAPATSASLARWAAAVADATEPSLVLNADAVIVAASASCSELLGFGDPASASGRPVRDAVAHLVDFTNTFAELDSAEAGKIPPLLAISSKRLARGLMRVACPATGTACTMDAIATPLWDGPSLAGSLTFFSKI